MWLFCFQGYCFNQGIMGDILLDGFNLCTVPRVAVARWEAL